MTDTERLHYVRVCEKLAAETRRADSAEAELRETASALTEATALLERIREATEDCDENDFDEARQCVVDVFHMTAPEKVMRLSRAPAQPAAPEPTPENYQERVTATAARRMQEASAEATRYLLARKSAEAQLAAVSDLAAARSVQLKDTNSRLGAVQDDNRALRKAIDKALGKLSDTKLSQPSCIANAKTVLRKALTAPSHGAGEETER